MRRRVGLAAGALLALAACGGPQPPWTQAPATRIDLRIAVEPKLVQLLQPVTVTLDLWTRDGTAADFAPAVDGADFVATTSALPATPLFGGQWQRTTIVCKPLRGPAEIVLPPFVAKVKDADDAASTPEQRITVASALAGASAAIEAPGEPFPSPFRGWWWIGTAAAAVAAGAGAWWLLRARRRRPDRDEVALPPHVKALRALERLHTASRTTRAQIELFYVETSQVLRVYLEERFALHAPERTTEEFLRELEGGEELAKSHRRELERFLSQCDLVKFAAHVPSEVDHETTWQLAAAFVEATRSDRTRAEAVA